MLKKIVSVIENRDPDLYVVCGVFSSSRVGRAKARLSPSPSCYLNFSVGRGEKMRTATQVNPHAHRKIEWANTGFFASLELDGGLKNLI